MKTSIFKNKYKEPRSGWVVTIVILLMLAGQLVAGALVPDMSKEPSISIKILVTGIYSIITIGGGILLYKIIYKQQLNQIGLIQQFWLKWLLGGLALGVFLVGIIFVTLMICGQAHVVNINSAKLVSLRLLVSFISLSFTVFSEEFLLRGFIMTALKTTRNKWVIFCTSACIFSLFHLLNPGVTILSFVNTLLGGLLFSYMFVKAGTLWLPIGFHIAWNFLQGDILGMNVSGNAQEGVFITSIGNKLLLTGGSYGIEGGILVTIVLILGFVIVKFFTKSTNNKGWTMEKCG